MPQAATRSQSKAPTRSQARQAAAAAAAAVKAVPAPRSTRAAAAARQALQETQPAASQDSSGDEQSEQEQEEEAESSAADSEVARRLGTSPAAKQKPPTRQDGKKASQKLQSQPEPEPQELSNDGEEEEEEEEEEGQGDEEPASADEPDQDTNGQDGDSQSTEYEEEAPKPKQVPKEKKSVNRGGRPRKARAPTDSPPPPSDPPSDVPDTDVDEKATTRPREREQFFVSRRTGLLTTQRKEDEALEVARDEPEHRRRAFRPPSGHNRAVKFWLPLAKNWPPSVSKADLKTIIEHYQGEVVKNEELRDADFAVFPPGHGYADDSEEEVDVERARKHGVPMVSYVYIEESAQAFLQAVKTERPFVPLVPQRIHQKVTARYGEKTAYSEEDDRVLVDALARSRSGRLQRKNGEEIVGNSDVFRYLVKKKLGDGENRHTYSSWESHYKKKREYWDAEIKIRKKELWKKWKNAEAASVGGDGSSSSDGDVQVIEEEDGEEEAGEEGEDGEDGENVEETEEEEAPGPRKRARSSETGSHSAGLGSRRSKR